jgi:hypothetical protein
VDLPHVNRDFATDRDAEVTGAPDEMRGIGAGDHCLRGHAAGVDAGSADELAFDQRDLHACCGQTPGEGGSRLPGTDDDRVEATVHDTPPMIRAAVAMPRTVFMRTSIRRSDGRRG